MNSGQFQGKVAVISGSSRGIGKAIAIELAKNGAFIVLNGRDESRLLATEKELSQIAPGIISVCCNVSTISGSNILIDTAVKHFGKIDILINNVGVSMRGNVADLNPEVFKTIFESNLLGAVYPTVPAIPYLRKTQGSLVFISSLAGIRGLPSTSAYCSSKMALRAIAESVRIEESKTGIHVGLIYVGITENEDGKETISADGTPKELASRKGKKGVQSRESVALAVLKNISKRKFISILTPIGKLNAFLQARFPMLVEKIILKNLAKFEERNK